MGIEILDTLKAVTDSTKAVVDSTLVKLTPVVETTIWQDNMLMQTLGILGGLVLIMVVILITTRDKKEK